MARIQDAEALKWGKGNFDLDRETLNHLVSRDADAGLSFDIFLDLKAYQSAPEMLVEVFDRLLSQPFQDWHLVLLRGDACGEKVTEIVDFYEVQDDRITALDLGNHGIWSLALAEQFHGSEADYCVLVGKPVFFSKGFLQAIVQEARHYRKSMLYYCDAVEVGRDLDVEAVLLRKPWDQTLLQQRDVTGGVVVVDREVLARVQPDCRQGDLWFHDLLVQLSRVIPAPQVTHLPYPLVAVKGVEAVELESIALPTLSVQPMVSVIIPTRDGLALMQKVFEGLEQVTAYPNLEIIVIDNGSEKLETLEFFAEKAKHEHVRILRIDAPFNFSSLNNQAAEAANGELLLFLNNDIEMTDPDWLGHMVTALQSTDAGAVGALLYYPDGRIQHAGAVIGAEAGVATHLGLKEEPVWMETSGMGMEAQELSAVTAACMLTRRDLFLSMKGFDPALQVAYNDVDYCLRLRELGRKVLLEPKATLIHHESATRSDDLNPENRERALAEVARMQTRWFNSLRRDPQFHPCLSMAAPGFTPREDLRYRPYWHVDRVPDML
ncbi:glycosyltransferase family 2 protein [Roseibium alexandrii]|uniref:N-glycosyltransferase n=1 Tax=Roseibium alexandrii TaxID=388408 RepID=A0A0M7ALL9_9HYPH|nr:glycosyltransferase family 2 protein [Roseibium alexandrii]CTQ75431.1 N-glycosyltransferase [Roseibium alexandrii]